jgi:hypothetical protein
MFRLGNAPLGRKDEFAPLHAIFSRGHGAGKGVKNAVFD